MSMSLIAGARTRRVLSVMGAGEKKQTEQTHSCKCTHERKIKLVYTATNLQKKRQRIYTKQIT